VSLKTAVGSPCTNLHSQPTRTKKSAMYCTAGQLPAWDWGEWEGWTNKLRHWGDKCTVKASNFGPYLARSIASLCEICDKNEQNWDCKSKIPLQLSFFFSIFL
jgi:hypothetical protein